MTDVKHKRVTERDVRNNRSERDSELMSKKELEWKRKRFKDVKCKDRNIIITITFIKKESVVLLKEY